MDDPLPYAQHRLKQATAYHIFKPSRLPIDQKPQRLPSRQKSSKVVKSRQTLAITGLCLQSNDLNAPQSPQKRKFEKPPL